MTKKAALEHLRKQVFVAQTVTMAGLYKHFQEPDQRAVIFTGAMMATVKALWDDRAPGSTKEEFRSALKEMVEACMWGIAIEEGEPDAVAGHA